MDIPTYSSTRGRRSPARGSRQLRTGDAAAGLQIKDMEAEDFLNPFGYEEDLLTAEPTGPVFSMFGGTSRLARTEENSAR